MISRLTHREAAINQQSVANHKRGSRAAKPQHGAGDLFGLAKTPGRNRAYQLFGDVFSAAKQRINHWCLNNTGTNRVDANAFLGVIERRSSRQSDHAVFRSDIGRLSGKSGDAAMVRSLFNFCSNSAGLAKMWNVKLPTAEVVSIFS